jgi:hypothetical protein
MRIGKLAGADYWRDRGISIQRRGDPQRQPPYELRTDGRLGLPLRLLVRGARPGRGRTDRLGGKVRLPQPVGARQEDRKKVGFQSDIYTFRLGHRNGFRRVGLKNAGYRGAFT